MLLLNAFARLVEVLLLLALAALGIGVGLYCLSGLISLGSARPDRLLHLPVVSRHVGHFLSQLAASGSTAGLALAGGVVAVLLGLLLLVGLLGSRRGRLLVVERDSKRGNVSARPKLVNRMAVAEATRAAGVTKVRGARVVPARRRRGGKLRVRASRGPDPDLATVDDAVHTRIDPLAEQFSLRPDVRVRLVEPKHAKGEDA